jgi:glycosyltransferase involved in cell wall biosynthesis
MTQKKIILFMPSVEGGGVEKNFFIISNFLGKKRGNVHLITAEKNLNKKLKNIKIINPKSNWWVQKGRLRKYLICIFLLIKEILIEKNSIVFSFQANLYAILVCKVFNTKIISRSNSSPSGWSKQYIKKLIYKIGLNLADIIIVNSKEFHNEMKKKFSVNTIKIYNPLNKKEIIKLSKKRIKRKFKKNRLKILNVGRLVDQKDQMTLLKAINLIKNNIKIHLIIIGRGKNRNELIKYIKTNKLQDSVDIFYTNNPFPYIKSTELFVLSSIFEGLPNVLLEAICLKKFIISSRCPTGPKEILSNGKGGFLFKMKDYTDLANKIEIYFKNKKKLKNKIDFSYKNLNRFDYNQNLNKYLKTVNSLIIE